jgi:hypothetical protein
MVPFGQATTDHAGTVSAGKQPATRRAPTLTNQGRTAEQKTHRLKFILIGVIVLVVVIGGVVTFVHIP